MLVFANICLCINRALSISVFSRLHHWFVFNTPSYFAGFSKGYKEAFVNGEQEPWLFRGGITGELQVQSSNMKFKTEFLMS